MEIEVGYCYLHPSEQIELCELFFDYHENPNACSDKKIDRIELLIERLVISKKSGSQETFEFVDYKKLSLVLCLYLGPVFDEGRLKILPKYDAPWDAASIRIDVPKKQRRNDSKIER